MCGQGRARIERVEAPARRGWLAPLSLVVGLWLVLSPVGATAGGNDFDGDTIFDEDDNCIATPNPNQCDSDVDGYGNVCDGDFSQDELIDGSDLPFFPPRLATSLDSGSVGTDMDCNCCVNANDFDGYFYPLLLVGTPGPSGLECAGSTPCGAGWKPVCFVPKCGQ